MNRAIYFLLFATLSIAFVFPLESDEESDEEVDYDDDDKDIFSFIVPPNRHDEFGEGVYFRYIKLCFHF